MKMSDDDKKAVIQARLAKALSTAIGMGAAGDTSPAEMLDALTAQGLKLSLAPIPKVAP